MSGEKNNVRNERQIWNANVK